METPEGDAELVVSWLVDNPGWHSRGEVVLELELDVADWSRIVGELVESGEVERTGERRGTRYRVA